MFPAHNVYTEVFFGGGTCFWAKKPAESETINDKLDILINFYRVLKMQFSDLEKWINASLISRTMHREALNIVKGKQTADPIKSAWAFWYVTNYSFANKIGGGYKYSNDMNTSVPKTLQMKKNEFTELLAKRIENAYIENEDAVKILKSRNVKNAFHYIDPPYMGADQGHYKGYTTDDFEALLYFLSNDCTGKFMLSNYPSAVLEEYVQKNGWHIKYLNHSSKHGAHVKHRKKDELIVWNYTAPTQIQISLL